MTKKQIVDIMRVEFHSNGNYVEAFEKAADKILALEEQSKSHDSADSEHGPVCEVCGSCNCGHKPTAPASLVEPEKWHDLKVVSPHWEALRSDIKPFEIRKNDRGYKVGDGLALRHWNKGEYVVSEAPQYFVVTSITDFPDGIKPGYVVMGISRYRPAPQADIVGELVKVLKYLDACGGLGYEKHEMIRTALLKYEEGR